MSNSPVFWMAHISEDTGFYMVGPQESIIFLKGNEQKNNLLANNQLTKIVVELAVRTLPCPIEFSWNPCRVMESMWSPHGISFK